MPIYEYRCNQCQKKDGYFFRSMSSTPEVACRHCGSREMTRLVSKVAFIGGKDRASRGLDDDPESLLIPPGSDWRPPPPRFDDRFSSPREQYEYDRDPRNIGRWVEERAKDYGLELPDSVHRKIEEARSGKMPEEVGDL